MIRVTIERVTYKQLPPPGQQVYAGEWTNYEPDYKHNQQIQVVLKQELDEGEPRQEMIRQIVRLVNELKDRPVQPPLEVVSPPKLARELIDMLKSEGLILDLAPPKEG